MSCGHDGCTCGPSPAAAVSDLPQVADGDHGGAGCCGGHGHRGGSCDHAADAPPAS